MSQCADEIAAAAWPDILVSVQRWDPEPAAWSDLGPWDASAWSSEILVGDPLPLIAVRTLCKWIVPETDGSVWWWTSVPQRPDALPLSEPEKGRGERERRSAR